MIGKPSLPNLAAAGIQVYPLPEGILVEKDVPVVMRDGVKIYTNVFVPEKEGIFPVIMSFTAYGKDIDTLKHARDYSAWRRSIGYERGLGSYRISDATIWEGPDPGFWVPNDYVVLHVDVRGHGKSEGKPVPMGSKVESNDYVELIDWAGTQKWSNGNVGLNGVSYLAITQWHAAAVRPPYLKAIVPWEGLSDMYRNALYHGGVPETGFFRWWQAKMKGENYVPPPEPSFGNSKTPSILNQTENDKNLENIVVPALICGSWSDQGLHSKGCFDAYYQISSKHKWLYTHGRGKWNVYYEDAVLVYQKRFLDYFLKGIDNGITLEGRVRLEVRKTLEEYEVRHESQWPLDNTVWTKAFLDGTKRSLTFEKMKSESTITYASTKDEEAVFDIRFQEETEITGPIKLKLWVSTDEGDDMDLLIGLKKLDTDGSEVHFEARENDPKGIVSNGWLRVSHRELDPERSTPWQPCLKHERPSYISPGQIVPVAIEILPSSTLFDAHDTLRLVVKGQDVISSHLFQHRELCNQGNHTIYTGGKYDSHLLLPIIPRP